MSFVEQWRDKLPASLAEAVRLAQTADSIDFSYGLLATAVLWPIRDPVQEFEPEAIAAVKEVSDSAPAILKVMQSWNSDRLAAGHELAEAAAADAELRRGLRDLLDYFDATHLLQRQLNQRFGDMPNQVIEHIQAALVNVGGVMAIDTLNLSLPAMPEIPPPAAPDRPPATPHFVGRESELTYFGDKLAENHVALVVGMAGVGKTALAAQLVRKVAEPDRVFWHSFHQGESVQALIWELANFLAWHGQDELWRLLQRAEQTGGQPPPPQTLFNYLLQMLRGRDYLICLDDFQYVDDDPLVELLLDELRDLLLAGDLDIVVTSRRMPAFSQLVQFDPLQGLSLEDARQHLGESGVVLEKVQLDALHTETGGNATFLTLAAHTLRDGQDVDQLLARLAEAPNVERFLLEEVDEHLTPEEQAVMAAVAVLLDYPGTRDAIEVICDCPDVWRLLQRLAQRHLLMVGEGEADRTYNQHAIIQAFYYNTLSSRNRKEMHRRAADYYEVEEPEPLRAGLHYLRAGDYEAAAALLTHDLWYFVNRGQTATLKNLLTRFDATQLNGEASVRVNFVLGQAETLLGESDSARIHLEHGLQEVADLPNGEIAATLHAKLCLAMANLLYLQTPREGLDWVRRGLTALGAAESELAAALLIKQAEIQKNFGELEEASATLEEALASLPAAAKQLRCEALLNMSPILHQRGEMERAIGTATEALRLSRRLEDHFRTIKILSNLGTHLFTSGLWDEAISTWDEARALSKQVGNREQEAFIEGNLGIANIYVGDYEAARRHLRKSSELDTGREANYKSLRNVFHRAKLAIKKKDLGTAKTLLTQTEKLAHELRAHDFLAEIDGLRAELMLIEGELNAARRLGGQAVARLKELDMQLEAGRVLRILAQIAGAEGRMDDALRQFASSYERLATSDPYEAALTQFEWGRLLQSMGSERRAAGHLEEARKTFARLGARRALADFANVFSEESTELSSGGSQ